jgi:tetratricopeptide (TPR) repeat protein
VSNRLPPSILVLIVLAIGVYWNSFPGIFLLDDFASIHQNPSIQSVSTSLVTPRDGRAVAGRPIANLSLAINYATAGLKPPVYLATNLFIHIACGIVLLLLTRLVLDSPYFHRFELSDARRGNIALASAALWLVHPIQSEPVNYIVARTESLMTLCALVTLYASLRAATTPVHRNRWQAVSMATCAIGMGCKESMAVVPLLAVLLDRALVFDSFAEVIKQRGRFHALLASTLGVLAALLMFAPRGNSAGFGLNAGLDSSLPTYLLNQCRVLWQYATLMVWPRHLVLDYGQVRALAIRDVWPQCIAILAAIGASAVLWWRSPLRGLPMVWVFIVLAPTTLVPIVTEIGAERRMYLASAAPIVASTIALAVLIANSRVRVALVAAMLVALSTLTIARNAEYDSAYRMWSTIVERWPHGRAYQNLAVEAAAAGRHDEVLPLLRLASSHTTDAKYALGVKLYEARLYAEAIENLTSFLQERPRHYQAEGARQALIRCWTDVGIVRANAGDFRLAAQAFQEALRLEPNNAQLRNNLAAALQDAQR